MLEPQSHWFSDRRMILGLPVQQLADDPRRRRRPHDRHRERLQRAAPRRRGHRQEGLPGGRHAGEADQDHQGVAYHTSRGVPVRELVDRCRRTLDRVRDEGVEAQLRDQRSWLDAFWARSDVEVRRPARTPAGHPLEPLPGGPGHRPGRAVRGARQGRHRIRLRRPLLLGHRGLRAAVPHLHLARDGPQRAAVPVQHARRGPRGGPTSWPRAARCSRGGRSTARRPRPTTPRAPRSTTSTPTSPTRCASTWTPPATRTSCAARASTSWSRPPGCGPTSASGGTAALNGHRTSTSTGSPAPTSTPPWSTTTSSPT